MITVAVTMRIVEDQFGVRHDGIDGRWFSFLAACGIVPILIPNAIGTVRQILEDQRPAGVLLTGGGDLGEYGGNDPERDSVERLIIDWAKSDRVPIIGVCRGMQQLLYVSGQSLVRVDDHVAVRHHLRLSDRAVNSFHALGAIDIDEQWIVNDRAGNVIESITHRIRPWSGIMWHPEREATPHSSDIELFRRLYGGQL